MWLYVVFIAVNMPASVCISDIVRILPMNWYNEPQSCQEQDGKITVTANGQTDFWRKTRHDFIADNGHFYYQDITGDFSAEVKVTGDYTALYDQAGLMARLDATMWIKCGIEFVEGIQYASVCHKDFSDWTVTRLPIVPSMWFRLSRYGSAVEVYFSYDGKDYQMLRQTYFTEAETLKVGLMCAAPKGDGFVVTFEDFQIQNP
jgi:regulation of enolase protein 1 (concanavalin A-like superfamily)